MIFKFIKWIGEQLTEAVTAEYHNPEAVMQELADLSFKLETGEIFEEEYEKKEADLLETLAESEAF